MLLRGQLAVEANGKRCEARQEEEYNDDGTKAGLSYSDHEGARRCGISLLARFLVALQHPALRGEIIKEP